MNEETFTGDRKYRTRVAVRKTEFVNILTLRSYSTYAEIYISNLETFRLEIGIKNSPCR